ncbi:MAG: TonB-dependent receptor [Tannerella sp.]|jgi:outer membrane receptor protein involved in Fe transport|nr:TonB-dependent receptor [Tannerella sp.]
MKYLNLKTSLLFLLSANFIIAKAEDRSISDDTLKTYNFEEVVITSSSKETNDLRRMPGAVSIISPRQIAGRQVASIKDISLFVPNLFMPDYGAKLTSAIYIRGVGARSSGQSAGLYVDNAPYMDKSSFDFELTDIQRIEVLRGPQGTLYGRNAMGGIISVHTLSPLDFQGTKASFSYGNYGRFDAKVSSYAKLRENFGLSAGIYYDRSDGFFTNAYNGKKIDDAITYGGNLKFAWNITSGLNAALSSTLEKNDQGAFPYGLYDPSTDKVAQVNINDESSYKRIMLGNNLSLTYQNNNILLTSTTGYQYLDDDMRMDQDFSDKFVFILNQLQKQHAFTEEITIKNKTENNYRWSFGVYGFHNKLHTDGPVEFKQDGIKTVLQPIFDGLKADNPRMPTITVSNETLRIPGSFETPSTGFAVYHQSTYNNLFINGLSITAGLRLDYERQRLEYDSEAKMNLSMTMSSVVPPTDISSMYPASIINERISQSFKQLLPKASLKYDFTPASFAYISAAKGYKTGGYNVQMSADIMQSLMKYDVLNAFRQMMPNVEIEEPKPVKDVISYKPETSWNYELGFRSELIKDYLQAELTLFYMDVNDLQITKFVSGGSGRYLSNAGKAESYGAEVTLNAQINDKLTASLNYGLTHATFLDYNNDKEDFKGKFIPYTPRHTLSLGLQYSKMLHGVWLDQITASAQSNSAGDIFWTERNDVRQHFYTVINAQAGVRKGIVTLNLWARNLTDTDYSTFYFESFSKPFMQKGKPLQYGVKINISF